MPLFSKSEVETTGQDLLAQYAEIIETAQAEIEMIAADAADRAEVVEARLQELEAEKLVLNQLGDAPKLLVARAGRVTTPQTDPDSY